MLKIVLATANPHKVEEINAITKDLGVKFVLPPEGFDPIEDGKTFEENALIKAKEANKSTQMMTLADDSGLCVDALGGLPGIYSARYAKSQQERIQKMLKELKDIPMEKRNANFVCAMVLLDQSGEVLFIDRGECHGKIGFEAKGSNGFGFDPIFVVNGYDITMAEMSEEKKNTLSHRALALQKIINWIETNINIEV